MQTESLSPYHFYFFEKVMALLAIMMKSKGEVRAHQCYSLLRFDYKSIDCLNNNTGVISANGKLFGGKRKIYFFNHYRIYSIMAEMSNTIFTLNLHTFSLSSFF